MITKEVLVGSKADPVFKSLVHFNIFQNYFEETLNKGVKDAPEGKERRTDLVGVLMLTYRKGIQSHSSGPIEYSKIKLSELGSKLKKESDEYTDDSGVVHKYDDGAYVIKQDKHGFEISDKHIFHNYIHQALRSYNKSNPERKAKNFLELAKMLVPEDFSSSDCSSMKLGSKSQMALAAAFSNPKTPSYLVRQTVYDGTAVGKVVKVGKGVEAEFFLYKIPDSELSKYDLKEEDFFNPSDRVIGVLRTYEPGMDKSVRNEYVVTPKDLGISMEFLNEYLPQKNLVAVTAGYNSN